ncbi:MAG: PAS domain-containing sensor histidine kinase, partial [Proteobacteria bacterium]|nr:PAS domain-containing sensor histidine kinase [Pseudomonadota bacterium]
CVYAVLVLIYSVLWLHGNNHLELTFGSRMLLGCIIEIFVFTSICCVALLRNVWIKPVTYIGMVHDSLLAAVFVCLTGFYSSPFLYLFLIIPLYGGITLKRFGGTVGALSVSVVLTILYFLPAMLYSRASEPLMELFGPLIYPKHEILSRFVSLGLAALGVGFLMGQLAHQYDRVQKNLIETDRQFVHLRGIYQHMLNALPIGIVITNPHNKRILYSNPSAKNMLGETLNTEHSLADTAPNPEMTEWDLKYNDRYYQIASFNFPFGNENVFSGYHILDVTEERLAQMERAKQQRLTVLGEFSAKVAHEIRNPLACISGCNEMLQADSHNEEQREICQMMGSEIDRLNALLSDILVFSRQPKLVPVELFLRQVIEKQKSVFLRDPANREIVIDIDIPEDLQLHADETSFCQIVMTLWRNSCEATDGKGHLSVIASPSPFRILFKDDGPGISESDVARIFEPFYTTKDSGTGLGLAIGRQLAHDNGLELSWDSAEKGFVIHF